MSTLNFINNSNDSNNSQIVIFQGGEQSPDEIATAWDTFTLTSGNTKSVPADDGQFYVAIVNPEVSVSNGVLKINEFSAPAVAMKTGQTASVTGDADAGYQICVEA
jgi:hypothetical protein